MPNLGSLSLRLALAGLVALLAAGSAARANDVIPDVPATREYHPPIDINGDGGFGGVLSGVRSGEGTSVLPYRINGWLIDPQFWTLGNTVNTVSLICIRIRNTTKYVVIEDNQLQNGNVGIQLDNAPNVTIHANQFSGLSNGILVPTLNTSLAITDNNPISVGNPIQVDGGSGTLTITGNNITGTSFNVVKLSSLGGTVTIDNNILGGSPDDAAIALFGVSATTNITQNNISCGGLYSVKPPIAEQRAGVGATSSPGLQTIHDNKFTNCRNAILLEESTAAITGNCFNPVLNGVVLADGSDGTTINGNDFTDDEGMAVLDDRTLPLTPVIDATGNWWGKAGGPNQGGGPERTYPSLSSTTSGINYSGFSNIKVAAGCGR